MGLRFRKSINLGGARINISKKGIGGSVGVKGARITKTADGKTRTTVGIPNTGISYVTESSSKKRVKAETPNNKQTAMSTDQGGKVFFAMLRVVLYLWGVLLLILCFPVGLILLGLAIFLSIRNRQKKKKTK